MEIERYMGIIITTITYIHIYLQYWQHERNIYVLYNMYIDYVDIRFLVRLVHI